MRGGWQRTVLAATVVLAVVVSLTWIFYTVFTSQYPGANDFYARWRPTRAWLLEGRSPYAEDVTRDTQIGMYGQPARPDQDKALFSYPLYSVVFFALPALISDYAWASAAWLAGLLVVMVGLLGGSLAWARWRPRPWLFGLAMLFGLVGYHGARTLILGQVAAIIAGLLVAALLLIRKGYLGWAGICLALASAKPQMALVLLPGLGLWALLTRRYRLLAGMAAGMAVLLGGSLLLRPSWLSEWRAQLGVYVDNSVNLPPVAVLANWLWPAQASLLQGFLSALLLAGVTWAWSRAYRHGEGHFEWAAMASLVATALVAPRTATTDYVMLMPVLFWALNRLQVRAGKAGTLLAGACLVVLFVGLWMLFALTVQGDQEQAAMYLPLPLLLAAYLLFDRPGHPAPSVLKQETHG